MIQQKNTVVSGRIEWIDILKGFGMICVVLGHLSPSLPVEQFIYSFHMPLFFFLSGFVKKEQANIGLSMKKNTLSLFIPFLLWDFLSFLVSVIGIKQDIITSVYRACFINGLRSWNAPIWFLLVLFLTKSLHDILRVIHIPNWVILLVSIAASPFIAPLEKAPFMLNLIPVAMAFFVFGIECRRIYDKPKLQEMVRQKPIVILSGILLLAVSIVFGIFLNSRISFTGADFGNYFSFYISAIGGILFFVLLFMYLPNWKLLNTIGKNSMFIMCFHYWIFTGLDMVSNKLFHFSVWHYRNTLKAIAVTIITIALCLFICFVVRKIGNRFPKAKKGFLLFGIK